MYNHPFLAPVAEMLSWHSCLSSDRALPCRRRFVMGDEPSPPALKYGTWMCRLLLRDQVRASESNAEHPLRLVDWENEASQELLGELQQL